MRGSSLEESNSFFQQSLVVQSSLSRGGTLHRFSLRVNGSIDTAIVLALLMPPVLGETVSAPAVPSPIIFLLATSCLDDP